MKNFKFYILIFLAVLLSEQVFAQNQFLSKDSNNPLELSYNDGLDVYSIKTIPGECNSLLIPECSRFYNPNNNFFSFVLDETGGVELNLLMREIFAGGISLFISENSQIREIFCTDFNTDNLNVKFLNDDFAGKLIIAQLWFIDDEASIKAKLSISSYVGNGQKVPVIDVSGYDAEQLITEVLVSGCVEASNVTFSGNPLSIGYFDNGVPGLDFESGIIISTGRASAAAGPNTSNSTGYFMNTPGDADLDALTGMTTYDASIIEFDFVPASDVITFEYVFGSEEYEEFVGMNLNDAFAFFVSGGPEGYANENVAIIPGVGVPVTINNVNSTTNSSYYINNIGGADLQYDGLTVTLTATIDVTECESYHIKLAIADVGDVLYDSGVFLKAGSFSSGSNVAIRTYNEWGLDDEVYEGCVNDITFSRTDLTTLDEDMPVILTIGGTATNGTDYSTLNTNYTIPAGEESITIPMEAYLDGLTEGSETVILTVFNGCPCDIETYTDTLYILDPLVFTSSLTNNGPVCAGNPATLTVNMNPIPDTVRVEWSTGAVGPTQITVTPAVTTTYTAMIY
ncbi:MAG: choice-of-anchor L domain-containing protein, partial [Bacteroidales bacterium]|nr:choice-of-anchor L domain-containing protein [Bacteroidales bacterium]